MKNTIFLWMFCLPLMVNAQNYDLNLEARNEVKKLDFLLGEWCGSGWMLNQSREKMNFEQNETVQLKINGTGILIEGIGTSEGQIVHNALAVITMAEGNGAYNFDSFLQSNQHGTFKAELIEDVLYWYPTENVRYVTRINERGQWFEIGEAHVGENWYQFFEMTLDKK
ncbi:hypothetical protein AAGF08_01415 [Algoriphagus sp. SE2]|uniref:hypothetical protein n=1 Tax=Algoriphagus sp. SE2 TaxID=3141536 RepID=UPI0031CD30B4